MTSLRQEIRRSLKQLLESHENEETANDVLQMVRQEALLLLETERVKDALRLDPFQCWKDKKNKNSVVWNRLFRDLQVIEYDRVNTKSGYCHIQAICRLTDETSCLDLHFHYERQGDATNSDTMAPVVSYTIQVSRNHGKTEKLLWVDVYSSGPTPSFHIPAINIMDEVQRNGNDNDDQDWEDMEEGDDGHDPVPANKIPKKAVTIGKRKDREFVVPNQEERATPRNDGTDKNNPDEEMGEDEPPDRFLAGIDPDVLAQFLEWSQLQHELEDDLDACYLLMTFPFYEFEFDLVGFLLEAVFGKEEDEEENDDEKM